MGCEGVVEQEVDKEVLTEDEQSAYWYQRYTLRHVMDGRGQPLRNHAGQPRHDVPSFLEPVKETILTTGESPSQLVSRAIYAAEKLKLSLFLHFPQPVKRSLLRCIITTISTIVVVVIVVTLLIPLCESSTDPAPMEGAGRCRQVSGTPRGSEVCNGVKVAVIFSMGRAGVAQESI